MGFGACILKAAFSVDLKEDVSEKEFSGRMWLLVLLIYSMSFFLLELPLY